MGRSGLHIGFLPAGDEDVASSRIRAFTLMRALRSLGVTTRLGYRWRSNVLLVQKKVTADVLRCVRRARGRGCRILYDVDDVGDALWYYAPPGNYEALLGLTDVVTTDTAGHGEYLLSRHPGLRVEIIPDAIDYYPLQPARLTATEGRPLRILWFGGFSNIALFKRYYATLAALPNVQVVLATNASAIPECRGEFPGIEVVAWSRATFVSVLQSCQLTCLMHDGTEIDRAKSNNRMITSVAWGVPALVSHTPEYYRTAAELGLRQAVFGDEDELRRAVEHYRAPEARNAYLTSAREPVWDTYSPIKVAKSFLGVLERHGTTPAGKGDARPSAFAGLWSWMRGRSC